MLSLGERRAQRRLEQCEVLIGAGIEALEVIAAGDPIDEAGGRERLVARRNVGRLGLQHRGDRLVAFFGRGVETGSGDHELPTRALSSFEEHSGLALERPQDGRDPDHEHVGFAGVEPLQHGLQRVVVVRV